jgi:hypothetical protein
VCTPRPPFTAWCRRSAPHMPMGEAAPPGTPAAPGVGRADRLAKNLGKRAEIHTPLLEASLPADGLPPADVHTPEEAFLHELADERRSQAPRAPRDPALAAHVVEADGARRCVVWAAASGQCVRWAMEGAAVR